jgi:hypothetical protein
MSVESFKDRILDLEKQLKDANKRCLDETENWEQCAEQLEGYQREGARLRMALQEAASKIRELEAEVLALRKGRLIG